MNYLSAPSIISSKDLIDHQYCLSAAKFKKVNIANTNIKYLRDLLDRPLKITDKGREVGSQSYIPNSPFKFMRTKSLQPESLLPVFSEESPISIIPSYFRDYNLKENDLLISKDSNIGEIVILDQDYENCMISGGIYKLPITKWKYYVLAFIKSDLFRIQLNLLVSKGSTMKHAKTMFLDCYIPFPTTNSDQTIQQVEALVQSIINKEKEIKVKHAEVDKIIMEELNKNKLDNEFSYSYPTRANLIETTRIDTGIYSEEFKKIDFLVKNYRGGFFFIEANKIKSGNTPNKRTIGSSSDLKYSWITPTTITDQGTLLNEERIDCEKNNINANAALIINRTSRGGKGEYVGISMFYNIDLLGKGQHNQGIYNVSDYPDTELIFMVNYLNSSLMRKYCAGLSIGSKMKEIKTSQFLTIPFPKFAGNIKEKINNLYYRVNIGDNNASFTNLSDFVSKDEQWNKEAGILELSIAMKERYTELNRILDQIITDPSRPVRN